MNEAQQLYEEYRSKFAEQYKHSIEDAAECQSVKLYKQYLEDKYNVIIDDQIKQLFQEGEKA